jgi:serine/threonine-protein kinase
LNATCSAPVSDARPSEPPSGELIDGKYQVIARIAEGGMGLVLRAKHLDLGRHVAIKVMRPEHAHNEEVILRMLAEARTAASLRSPHVNRVLDFGRLRSGAPYIVLEYLEGSDLCQLLNQRGCFPAKQSADIVLQACEALAEAHALGIVHRDLKPENLFLSEEPGAELELKILDFGISKTPASRLSGRVLTNPWQVMGSPTYMAPEQMKQSSVVDARADIWALGVVLYELCTAQPPFDADVPTAIFRLVLEEEPPPPRSIVPALPEGLEEVILKCLRKDVVERYQTVVELATALAPFGSDPNRAERIRRVANASAARQTAISLAQTHPAPIPSTPMALVTSHPASTSEPNLRPRRRWGRIALAGALVALAGTAGYWTVTGSAGEVVGPRAALAPPAAAHPEPAPPPPPEPPSLAPATTSLTEMERESPIEVANDAREADSGSEPPSRKRASSPSRKHLPGSPAPVVSYRASSASQGASASLPASLPADSAQVSRDSVPPAASTPKSSSESLDPWDPKSFGGRR